MSDHEWKEGDEALHVTRGVVVTVKRVLGPKCLIVEFEDDGGPVLKIDKGRRPTTATGKRGTQRFATTPQRLRLIEDCTEE